jgi:signal transduction histidine kinase
MTSAASVQLEGAAAREAVRGAVPTSGKCETIDATDLAELMSAFNEVTTRLEATHRSLESEVVRLKGELREANERLARSKRLAALGEMAAGIAHEVRNPLGSISLYAQMLQQDLGEQPAQRELAGKIRCAVQGLDAVVGDVLSFAREIKPRLVEVEPLALVERAIDSACPESDPGREWIQIDPSIVVFSESISCDASLMRQAIVNVVRNAVDAVRESDGDVTPRVAIGIERSELETSAAVTLWVTDSGPGVSDEVVERMFNPFFTTRAAGTGLGLPIVHRILDAHGGQVEVRNNHGAPGATVELTLPVRARPEGFGIAKDRRSLRQQEA